MPSDEVCMVQGDRQLPSQIDDTSVMASLNQYNASIVFGGVENTDTRRRILRHWRGSSHVLLSLEDQAAHEALHHEGRSSSDSALLVGEISSCLKLREAPGYASPCGQERRRISHHNLQCTEASNSTRTGPSTTSKAEPSVGCIAPGRPTLDSNESDISQVILHKVKEGKVAHKRAEQKRRNERSSLITELEHGLPPEFLDGCQPGNQKPGHTKNGILEATIKHRQHQATVIMDQAAVIKEQAAVIEEQAAVIKERNKTIEVQAAASER